MPRHQETHLLPYELKQVFNLVADVEKYPEFLPWCVASRIRSRESDTVFTADLAVGFQMLREKFTSKVILEYPSRIRIIYQNGPFKTLRNCWDFSVVEGEKATEISFFLEFEFRSKVLQKMIGTVFEEAVTKMVAAFEARAKELFDNPRTNLSQDST